MSGYLVAPTEPETLKRKLDGRTTTLPEAHGVDVMWLTRHGFAGVQRKELSDFVASVNDGRLAQEVAQMQDLAYRMVVLEGRGTWSTEGQLLHGFTRVTRAQLRGMLWSIQDRDVWVDQTDDLNDTVETIRRFRVWTEKERHVALSGRPKPAGRWGTVTSRDYAVYVLTSFPGVGPGRAEAILEHFGKVPLAWTVSERELGEVPGIGPGTAKKMADALDA